jgi:anti-sigma B factor antagonist
LGLLTIAVTADDHGPVVVLSGEADLTTVPEMTAALATQIDVGPRYLTVDLSALVFLDSASVAALITAARALEASGGTLRLAGPQGAVARTLDLLSLDQIIPVHGRAVAGRESGPDG